MRRMALLFLSAFLLASSAAAQCRYRYDHGVALPDAHCTPGAVRTTKIASMCPHAHTRAIRHVTEATKLKVCASYGIKPSGCNGKNYEIDHLISLELGGSNSIKNLWPEPWLPHPGAHDKDHLENWLHAKACARAWPLVTIQHWISTNWRGPYELMEHPSAPSPSR